MLLLLSMMLLLAPLPLPLPVALGTARVACSDDGEGEVETPGGEVTESKADEEIDFDPRDPAVPEPAAVGLPAPLPDALWNRGSSPPTGKTVRTTRESGTAKGSASVGEAAEPAQNQANTSTA